MEIISRKEARDAGQRHFFTGKACKRGHIRERAVATGSCLGCLAHYAKEYAGKFRISKVGQAMGMVEHKVQVRERDMGKIDAFAALIARAVTAGTPEPLIPHPDDVVAVNDFINLLQTSRGIAAVNPPPFDPYPMWVRLHGPEIADQMRGGT